MKTKAKTKKVTVKQTQTKPTCRKLWVAIIWFIIGAIVGGGVVTYFAYAPVSDVEYECINGGTVDSNGCCPGEVYKEVGDQGFNCCPESGGDCFPPIIIN